MIISDDLAKVLLTLAFPFIAFLSLVIWMGMVLSKNRSLNVDLKFLGLSLSVSALPVKVERRGVFPHTYKEPRNDNEPTEG